MTWASLTSLFAKPRGNEAVDALAQAYRDVFRGNATQNQAQMVLADLADYSGYYKVSPAVESLGELAAEAGKRSVFARIAGFLHMSDSEIRALQEAARQESLSTQYEGEI